MRPTCRPPDQFRLHRHRRGLLRKGRTQGADYKGNVVGPDSGVLTTIVSQDPMHVDLSGGRPPRNCRAAESERPTDVKDIKVQDLTVPTERSTIRWASRFRRRFGGSVRPTRHRGWPSSRPGRPADRRPAGAGQSGRADAHGLKRSMDLTGCADCRPARRLCFRGGGRQGCGQARQDGRRERRQCGDRLRACPEASRSSWRVQGIPSRRGDASASAATPAVRE